MKKGKEKKLLKHCTVDSGGFCGGESQIGSGVVECRRPPELELGFNFYGTWRPEAGGRLGSPCARPQLEKKKMPWKVREPMDVDASGGHTASLNVSTSL